MTDTNNTPETAETLGTRDGREGREPLWYRVGKNSESYVCRASGHIGNPERAREYLKAYAAAREIAEREAEQDKLLDNYCAI
jgi:hypothetical protein